MFSPALQQTLYSTNDRCSVPTEHYRALLAQSRKKLSSKMTECKKPGAPLLARLLRETWGSFQPTIQSPGSNCNQASSRSPRVFTSGARDLPLSRTVVEHEPGCPTSHAPFARDVGKFPTDNPIPREQRKPGVIPKSPRFHQRGEGSPSPRTRRRARTRVPHFSRALCARRGEVSSRQSNPAGTTETRRHPEVPALSPAGRGISLSPNSSAGTNPGAPLLARLLRKTWDFDSPCRAESFAKEKAATFCSSRIRDNPWRITSPLQSYPQSASSRSPPPGP